MIASRNCVTDIPYYANLNFKKLTKAQQDIFLSWRPLWDNALSYKENHERARDWQLHFNDCSICHCGNMDAECSACGWWGYCPPPAIDQIQVESGKRRSLMNREAPSIEELEDWEAEGGCEATDGCWVEPDGTCPHGKPSWLLALGMI